LRTKRETWLRRPMSLALIRTTPAADLNPEQRLAVEHGIADAQGPVQLRADAIDIPVSTLMTEEASSAGSAMLTGVCAKVYPDLTAAADRFVRRRDRFEPNQAVVEQLARARQRWSEAGRMPL